MRIAERLRRERCDHLTKTDVALRECLRLALRAEEDCANDRRSPTNRYDYDRPHVAHVERRTRCLQHWIVRGVRNEHRVT